MSLTPYLRAARNGARARGIYGSLLLTRQTRLFGGSTQTRFRDTESRWLNLGLRTSLPRKVALTLQRTKTSTRQSRSDVHQAMLSVPFGRLRVFARYQYRTSLAWRSETDISMTTHNHEIFGGASLHTRRLKLQFQTASRWRRDSVLDQWQQLSASLRINRKTFVDAFSVLPDENTVAQNRFRLRHNAARNLTLLVEYGNVSPYQGIGLEPEDRRLKLMLQKRFEIHTPTRGADVDGVVRDALGTPIEGALIRLGRYAALTNKQGRYGFRYVPEGDYVLQVDDSSLPADYAVGNPPITITANRTSALHYDWTVLPLGSIAGVICEDRNQNRECETDESIERVPVYLSGRATASRQDGVFLFHNLVPGRYSVRLKEDALPADYVLASAPQAEVSLKAGKPAALLYFFLKRRQRQIIFQDLEK